MIRGGLIKSLAAPPSNLDMFKGIYESFFREEVLIRKNFIKILVALYLSLNRFRDLSSCGIGLSERMC